MLTATNANTYRWPTDLQKRTNERTAVIEQKQQMRFREEIGAVICPES